MRNTVDVVVVNVNHTHNGQKSWKADAERFSKAKLIVTEEHGQVKAVYTFSSVKEKDGGRVNPRDYKRASTEVYKQIKAGLNVSRKKGEANPVRYMKANVK